MHKVHAPYSPCYPRSRRLFPGTFYLKGVDVTPMTVSPRMPQQVHPEQRLWLLRRFNVLLDWIVSPQPVTEKLQVLEEASQRIVCVVAGTAVGLPGKGGGGND